MPLNRPSANDPIYDAAPMHTRLGEWLSAMRGGLVLATFAGLTLSLSPIQAVLKRLSPAAARQFPHRYHRMVCRLLGIRVHVHGAVVREHPVLLVSNHSSWLDIPVLSAVAPVSFVAKSEVSGWPGVSVLAKLQQTVFVDRTRRARVGTTAGEISDRLQAGDTIVLFAEGTSTDGNRVLPFRSSLFAPVAQMERKDTADGSRAMIQPVSIAYTRLHGVPLGRAQRHLTGWYGDMDLAPHAWDILRAGPIDVCVSVGPPVPLGNEVDRKALARLTEAEVRDGVVRLLRGIDPAEA